MALLNKKILAFYLTYQFVPKPLHLNPASRSQQPAFIFPTKHNSEDNFIHPESRIAEELYAQLNNSIKKSLNRTTGSVGLLLSGGLDSTILLHLLRKNTRREIYTISGAYSPKKAHLTLCAALAKKYNTIHQELILIPADLSRLKNLYSRPLANPIGDNGFLATQLMIERLSTHTSFIYTGDGADCLFQGLPAHYLNFIDKNLRRLSSGISFQRPVNKELLLSKILYPDYEHYKYGEIFFTVPEARQYLNTVVNLAKPLKSALGKLQTDDPVKQTILLDLNFLVNNRVDYILESAARSKANVILPYLDSCIVDYSLKIPSCYFIKNNEQKYILKKAFDRALPRGIITRKKEGFSPPFLEWYRQNHAFVRKTIHQAPLSGISSDYIHYLLDNINLSNHYNHGMKIWLILNLALWHETILKKSNA